MSYTFYVKIDNNIMPKRLIIINKTYVYRNHDDAPKHLIITYKWMTADCFFSLWATHNIEKTETFITWWQLIYS